MQPDTSTDELLALIHDVAAEVALGLEQLSGRTDYLAALLKQWRARNSENDKEGKLA